MRLLIGMNYARQQQGIEHRLLETHADLAEELRSFFGNRDALEQLAEEGVVQLFIPADGSPAIVGVVGALQLDVLADRLAKEDGVPVSFEPSRYEVMRWFSCDDAKKLDEFISANRFSIATDLDGDPVFMAQSAFNLNYTLERVPEIRTTEIKEMHKPQ
jgi:peptide chain release factor 3